MPTSLLKSSEYRNLMQQHMHQMIELLFKENVEFRIICDTSYIEFTPGLPDYITQTFGDIIIFDIAEYSFESASIENGILTFEAGFGAENIGAAVHVPLLAIARIFIDEGHPPLAINFAKPIPRQEPAQTKSSMEALLSNPKNLGLLKKKGKL